MSVLKYIQRMVFGTRQYTSLDRSEFFWRASWIFMSIILVSYASFLYFASVHAEYFGEPPPTVIRDSIKRTEGEHHLSGKILVPTSCNGLTVIPRQLDTMHYQLDFTTWQEPSRTCEPHGASRVFSAVIFSHDDDIQVSAILDGKTLPIQVTRDH